MPVILWIESIGGGWVGGGRVGGRGRVRSHRWVKAPIQTQTAVLCLQYVTQTGRIFKGGPNCCEDSLIPHAVLLMSSSAMKCTQMVKSHL